jgi:hypothetical protein
MTKKTTVTRIQTIGITRSSRVIRYVRSDPDDVAVAKTWTSRMPRW